MREHLDGTLKDATGTMDSLDKGVEIALHLCAVFQTGIYTSQLGKLKDVFDPLVMQVIRFYDRLANLERIKSRLTVVSFELATAKEDPSHIATHYRDTLREVIKRINDLLPAADALLHKLPK